MPYHSFEELDVWKRSSNLTVKIYNLFKNSREFAFRDQINRSSLSIPSNIAEGCERNTNPDFIRFLHIAKGSSAELRSQIFIAERIGIISNEEANDIIGELKELSSMLHGLITYLKSNSDK
jgi:four helix bundle protein